jgi:uncharacterized protein
MTFVATNIVFRYFTGDDPVKARACYQLLQRVKAGQEKAQTSECMVAEVCYVLSSAHYGLSRDEIRAHLLPIVSLRGLKLPRKSVVLRVLDLYAAYPRLDFEDALAVAYMERDGITTIYSYDRDFDRVPGIIRAEP